MSAERLSAEAAKGRRWPILQAAISLVSVAAVVWWGLGQDAPTIPRTFGAATGIALALFLYALATLARGERWHQILERGRVGLARAETYRLTTVGYMGNNVLPARGGDLLRVFLLGPVAGIRKREALGTVVAERLLDVLALAFIFVVVGVGVLRELAVPGSPGVVAGALAAVTLAALAGVLVARAAGALERVREFARPLLAATRNLVSAHGAALLTLSVILWTLEALVYLAVARVVDLELGVFGALYVVALTNLFALVPAAPGYVGTFDAAVVFGARSLGAGGSEAIAYLLLLRFVLFVPITLVGLVFLLRRYGGWSGYRTARVEAGA